MRHDCFTKLQLHLLDITSCALQYTHIHFMGTSATHTRELIQHSGGTLWCPMQIAVELFGWRKGELEGKNLATLVPCSCSLAAPKTSAL